MVHFFFVQQQLPPKKIYLSDTTCCETAFAFRSISGSEALQNNTSYVLYTEGISRQKLFQRGWSCMLTTRNLMHFFHIEQSDLRPCG